MISALAVRRERPGAADRLAWRINLVDPVAGRFERILTPEQDKPFNRSNDGPLRPRRPFLGRHHAEQHRARRHGPEIVSRSGTLWRIDPDRRVTAMVRDIYVSEHGVRSPDDRTMYFGDSMAGWIYAFDFDLASGTLKRRREFAQHPRGLPDGSAIDAQGYLWNCRWGGGMRHPLRP